MFFGFIATSRMWRFTEIDGTWLNSIHIYFWGKPSIESIAIFGIIAIDSTDSRGLYLILKNNHSSGLITEKVIEFLKQKFQIPDKRIQKLV